MHERRICEVRTQAGAHYIGLELDYESIDIGASIVLGLFSCVPCNTSAVITDPVEYESQYLLYKTRLKTYYCWLLSKHHKWYYQYTKGDICSLPVEASSYSVSRHMRSRLNLVLHKHLKDNHDNQRH